MPEHTIIKTDRERWRYLRRSFFEVYEDRYTEAPIQNPDSAIDLAEFLPVEKGILIRRWGTVRFDTTATTIVGVRFYDFNDQATPKRRLIVTGEDTVGGTKKVKTLDTGGVVKNTSVFTMSASAVFPRCAISRNQAYFVDDIANDRVKYDGHDTSGSGVTTWGITAPTTALAASASGSGSLSISFWRDYCFCYTDGTHVTGISPFVRLGPVTDKAQVDLTSIDAVVATESGGVNTGSTDRIVLATSDGGPRTKLYKVLAVGDTTTTTATDTTLEADLILNNVYLELSNRGAEIGVTENSRPPTDLKFPIKHRGRLYGISGQTIRASKNLREVTTSTALEIAGRYEECWPAKFVTDISDWVDDATGLLSDGNILYIGTKRRIYALYGDGPATWQTPQVVHEVGVLNQDVWQLVRVGGTIIGAIWVTPEHLICFSDGNTFRYIDKPLRGTFSENSSYGMAATYASLDNLDLYILQVEISSARKFIVYNVRTQRWIGTWTLGTAVTTPFFWIPSDGSPQILFGHQNAGQANRILKFDPTAPKDILPGGTTQVITSIFSTPWLDLNDLSKVKILGEVEIIGASGNRLTVYAASDDSALATLTSNALVTNATFSTLGVFGDLKYNLLANRSAVGGSKYKFYRIKLDSGTADTTTVALRVLRFLSLDFTYIGRP